MMDYKILIVVTNKNIAANSIKIKCVIREIGRIESIDYQRIN